MSDNRLTDYDRELTLEHSYLGKDLVDMQGRLTLEESGLMRIMIIAERLILIPGQTLPLLLYHHNSPGERRITESKVFGVIYPKNRICGTLAEVRSFKEETVDSSGNLLSLTIKAVGRQRFEVLKREEATRGSYLAEVRLIPELILLAPHIHLLLEGGHHKNAMNYSLPWPSHVSKMCDANLLLQELIGLMRNYIKKEPPTLDMVAFSFWAMATLPLNDDERERLLMSSSVQNRLFRLRQLLSKEYGTLVCAFCFGSLAAQADLFTMWTTGSQGVFVNPAGIVHELITAKKSNGYSIELVGPQSDQHSWFPGYSWTITQCRNCSHHLGWMFSTTLDLNPKDFFGFSRNNVRFGWTRDTDERIEGRERRRWHIEPYDDDDDDSSSSEENYIFPYQRVISTRRSE